MKKFTAVLLTILVTFCSVSPVMAADSSYKNVFSMSGGNSKITIDGRFDDWNQIPHSYEYNWDNSNNCWYYGVWIDGVCYKTPVGTYDSNVRHKVGFYCDGENVYLHIEFSRDYYAKMNGENYSFSFDGNKAFVQLTYNGKSISGNSNMTSPGTYPVEVRHATGSDSFRIIDGAQAMVLVKPGNVNAELELKVPINSLKKQNPAIDPERATSVTWACSNLAYRTIVSTGTSTGPVALCAMSAGIVVAAYFLYDRRKKNGNIQV